MVIWHQTKGANESKRIQQLWRNTESERWVGGQVLDLLRPFEVTPHNWSSYWIWKWFCFPLEGQISLLIHGDK